MCKITKILNLFGLALCGLGCWQTYGDMRIALVLAFTGLTFIFTGIQIEERV